MKTAAIPMSKGSNAAELFRRVLVHRNQYLLLLSAFLLGSSSIAGGALPLGTAFFAAISGTAGVSVRILIAMAVIAGAATQHSLELVYINAACMLVYSVLHIPLKDTGKKPNIKAAAILFVGMLVPQLMLAGLQGFLLYDVLKAVFSSFISLVLYFIYTYALPIMAGTVKRSVFSGEEAISIAVTAALVLSGIGPLELFGVSLRNILCIVILLLFSSKCGSGTGAAAGVAMGLISSISKETTPVMTGAYALCGMLAGLLGNLGKAGAALGFVMGNMILAAYLNGAAEGLTSLREVLAAAAVFLVIPKKFVNLITDPFKKDSVLPAGRKGYTDRIREVTAERLEKFSRAFLELSKTFQEISEAKLPAERQEINVLFDRVADRICSGCSLCQHCWERNFYDTYQVMFKIIETLESKGRVDESDVPGYFLDKCARINEFVQAVNNMYELFRVGIVWKGRLNESRGVISRQFEGMSRVISGLAAEINTEIRFMGSLEADIAAALHKEGIKARDVIAYENAWGKYEISILHNDCGGARECVSIIEKAASASVGRKMIRESRECVKAKDGNCCLKLVEAENLKLTTGIARLPQYGSNVSGDSFTFMNSGKGKYTLALSDGMGSGYAAAAQSKAAVNMLESFLESGFDKDMAVNLINSVLVLKADENISCTIDLSVIDLFNGEVEFIKTGAAPTYIKRGDKVDIIRSASLPAGILSGIDTEIAHRTVEDGDMIIMVTDGIIDSMAGDEPGERLLMKTLQQISSTNPQQIADTILAEADRCSGGKPCDDLTVMVAKVWKKLQ